MTEVSVIIPCYNEEKTIALLLDALLKQSYPAEKMEVIIADALSTDGTRAVIGDFLAAHQQMPVRVVDNPRRTIPSALNEAFKVVNGEFIVRLDAHSVPRTDYVERCVSGLKAGLGDNVGGVWDIQPGAPDWIGRSIAAAAAHPLGVGDAQYRHTRQAQHVDTVPFGSYRRALLERIGVYDETLLANEDYEFNVRLRRAGGKVWLDPAICTTYFARPTLKALAQQYWRYGTWKQRMLRCYPETLRWRQALPPLFVAGLAVLILLSIFLPQARPLLLAALGVYFIVLLGVGVQQAVLRKDAGLIFGVPLAIATMHVSWGSGFIVSLFKGRD